MSWVLDNLLGELQTAGHGGSVRIEAESKERRRAELLARFPKNDFTGIDWDHVPDHMSYANPAIETREINMTDEVAAFAPQIRDFLGQVVDATGLDPDTEVVFQGDNMPSCLLLRFRFLEECFQVLLSYPQDVWVFPEDYSWCFEFTHDCDMHFGLAP